MDWEMYSKIYGGLALVGILSIPFAEKIFNYLHERNRKNSLAEITGKQCMENILDIACYETGMERQNKLPRDKIKNSGLRPSLSNFYDKVLFQRYLNNNPKEREEFNRDFEMYHGILRMRTRDIERSRLKFVKAEYKPI